MNVCVPFNNEIQIIYLNRPIKGAGVCFYIIASVLQDKNELFCSLWVNVFWAVSYWAKYLVSGSVLSLSLTLSLIPLSLDFFTIRKKIINKINKYWFSRHFWSLTFECLNVQLSHGFHNCYKLPLRQMLIKIDINCGMEAQ